MRPLGFGAGRTQHCDVTRLPDDREQAPGFIVGKCSFGQTAAIAAMRLFHPLLIPGFDLRFP